MKFLHTSDLHLYSKLLNQNGDLRRKELLDSFKNNVAYAVNGNFDGVLLCGDIFDGDYCAESTFNNFVYLLNNSAMKFYVLCGNHGSSALYAKLKKSTKENVFYFPENGFACYDLGKTAIWGVELDGDDEEKWKTLHCDADKFNVVMLHCDVKNPSYGLFDKDAILKNNVDYVALGHVHFYSREKLGKTTFCYCGAPEPRGFDEEKSNGFVVLDTEKNTATYVRQSLRKVTGVSFDASGCSSDEQLFSLATAAVKDVSADDYVEISVTGEVEKCVDVQSLSRAFGSRFFALRVRDNTKTKIDLAALKASGGVRGAFVTLCESLGEDSETVLKMGLTALDGEDLK